MHWADTPLADTPPPGGHWNAFLFDAKNFARKWDPGIIISKKYVYDHHTYWLKWCHLYFRWSKHSIHWIPLTTSSVTTSTQLQQADFVLKSEHFSLTSMFKKCDYNQYHLSTFSRIKLFAESGPSVPGSEVTSGYFPHTHCCSYLQRWHHLLYPAQHSSFHQYYKRRPFFLLLHLFHCPEVLQVFQHFWVF